MNGKWHFLKCENPYFSDLLVGKKTFEIRKNDRDFKVGDYLILSLYNPITKTYEQGGQIITEILYIMDDTRFLQPGYVALGIRPPTMNPIYINPEWR